MTSLAERLRRVAPSLGPAQRRVAEALLRDYPVAGLGRVSDLAATADVSAPTVTRCIARLGFDSLKEFREAVRAEIGERLTSPLERLDAASAAAGLHAGEALLEQVARSLTLIEPAQLEALVDLVVDPKRTIIVTGGRVSDVVARHLAWSLTVLRPGVRYVGPNAGERINALLDVDPATVVVAFDLQRYQLDTVRFVEAASRLGARCAVVTDRGLSPAVEVAEVVVATLVAGPGIFDAITPTLAVVELLIAAATERLGAPARDRLERYEALTSQLLEVEQ